MYRVLHDVPVSPSPNKFFLSCVRYKSKDEFAADSRLVFDNCETFNEDESEVGQAGHILRAFFEKRWAEILADHCDQQSVS